MVNFTRTYENTATLKIKYNTGFSSAHTQSLWKVKSDIFLAKKNNNFKPHKFWKMIKQIEEEGLNFWTILSSKIITVIHFDVPMHGMLDSVWW